MKFLGKVFEGAVVAPVAEEEWCDGFVIVTCTGTMESHWASKAIRVLERVVAVIPGCTVLGHPELVSEAVASGDWALGDAVDAVVLKRVKLPDAMPMDGSAVVLHIIVHCDLEPVAPAGFNPWTRVLLIEGFATIAAGDAISINGVVCCVKCVLGSQSVNQFLSNLARAWKKDILCEQRQSASTHRSQSRCHRCHPLDHLR